MYNFLELEEIGALAGIAIFYLVILGIAGIAGLVFYILQAIGIYKMGKSLNVSAPWLSFIPVANSFALGRIASKYVKKDGKNSVNFGVWLLVLEILMYILLVAFIACTVIGVISIIGFAEDAAISDSAMSLEMFKGFIPVIILYVILLAVEITYLVLFYVSLWRIFSIFSAQNATLFTVLSIFFTFLYPIFLFIVRNDKPTLAYPERMGFENL